MVLHSNPLLSEFWFYTDLNNDVGATEAGSQFKICFDKLLLFLCDNYIRAP